MVMDDSCQLWIVFPFGTAPKRVGAVTAHNPVRVSSHGYTRAPAGPVPTRRMPREGGRPLHAWTDTTCVDGVADDVLPWLSARRVSCKVFWNWPLLDCRSLDLEHQVTFSTFICDTSKQSQRDKVNCEAATSKA